ncbi:hypothetical protein [Paenibacillus sp. OK076]|uniref:hypothetical protein n=1 Tax=Paenibacillus sp. OK076 TaxID=1884379 RepID=UPI0008D32A33|nr:hypothetical protein [Paenibacillus sp. OK076]SEN92829.1 3'-5' exoribonuclease [Paenibacillus sp. OK076]
MINIQPIDLHSVRDGEIINGLIYITDYTPKTDAAGKAPIYGTCHYYGKTIGFKICDEYLQNNLNINNLVGAIALIKGNVDSYNDKIELTLTEINFQHGVTDINIFYKRVDVESVFKSFVQFVNSNLTQPAATLLFGIFQKENLFDPFKVTWAGAKMHDAQIGGLMNHTMKMLRLARTLIENDSRLAPWADLLYLSIILHVIGKVLEIEDGVYTGLSYISHRVFGAEITMRNKDEIVVTFGEKFYYDIISVQLGHHGEFADKPVTIWAYIVHLIDMLEAHTTGFLDKLENGDFKTKNGQKTVYVNSSNLVV